MTDRFQFGKYIRSLLIIGDFVIINMAYLLVRLIMQTSPVYDSKWVWFVMNVAYIPCSMLFSDIHKLRILYADRLMIQALKSTALYTLVILTLFYILDITDVGFSDGLCFISLYFVFIILWWLISHKTLKKIRCMGFNYQRTIIVGATDYAERMLSEIHDDPGYGYRILGVFDDDAVKRRQFESFYNTTTDKIDAFIRDNKINTIFYSSDTSNSELLAKVMRIAEELDIELIFIPKLNPELRGHFTASSVGTYPIFRKTKYPLSKGYNKFLKRAFDITFSSVLLLFSPIVFIPVAIGIKLSSPGPIFFKQRRTGIYGKDFMCWKFRTMRVNTDADKVQATADDPRKTRFGNFLRKTSIDELPQFVNVLIGNMSVVGPRPHMVSQTEDYSRLISKYMVRHAVKPGITGWAQVNGYRGSTEQLWQMEKRVEYDVWYIHHWNFFLDLKIIFRTITNALHGESNAY